MPLNDDIAKLQEQEKDLRFKSFNEDDAWKLGCQMRDACAERNLPLVIDIRLGHRQLFYAAMPGTNPDNDEWVRRKSNSVQRFHKSTYRINRELEQAQKTLAEDRYVDEADYASHGGGFPIHVTGAGIIGAITVSGIPQRQDHGFVVEQVALWLNRAPQSFALDPAEQ